MVKSLYLQNTKNVEFAVSQWKSVDEEQMRIFDLFIRFPFISFEQDIGVYETKHQYKLM